MGNEALSPSLLLGPQASAGVSLGGLHPWVAWSPQWQVSGKRDAVSDLFTEWRGEAGIAIEGPVWWHRLSATLRRTSAGGIVGVQYGLSFRPTFKTPDPDEEAE